MRIRTIALGLGLVVGCGGGRSGGQWASSPAAQKTKAEEAEVNAARDQCIAGSCDALIARCLPVAQSREKDPLRASWCLLAELKLDVNPQSAAGYFSKLAPYDNGAANRLVSLAYKATPEGKRDIGETLCHGPAPAWATNDDPLDGDKDDYFYQKSSGCHLIAEYYAKGAAMDLPKALGAEREGCEALRGIDPLDKCAYLRLLVEHTLVKEVPQLAMTELRAPCDAAKPNVDDGGAHACLLLANLVAETAPDDAMKLAQKACTIDGNECDAMMTPYVKLTKTAPAQATSLALWAWERRTPTDARGSSVYMQELFVGATKDPAKAGTVARELCASPARGTAMACFQASGVFPAEKAVFEERGKAKMKADLDAMTAELTERSKADAARRDAHQRERQAKRDAAQQARTKAAAAAAATPRGGGGGDDDDDAPPAKGAARQGDKTRTVSGFGHGPNRDLTCTQAKLSAVSRAGCSGFPSSQSGECSCSQAFKQWTCNVSLTVTCR